MRPCHLLLPLSLSLSLSLSPALAPGKAHAQSFEDIFLLDRRIAGMLGSAARAMPVDPRLKLAACPAPAVIEAPMADAVSVRCPALGWRIRVPLSPENAKGGSGAYIVRRGDPVEIRADEAGFAVTTTMTAIEDGTTGKAVRVKSPSSGMILPVILTGPGMAALAP